MALGFQSLDIHLYTNLLASKTREDEEEWFDRIRKENDSFIWAIVPSEEEGPIGVTGIHHVNVTGGCSTGIAIWNKRWWGRGVASRAHMCRTLFAADFLNRLTISSTVRTPNEASRKALERIGYIITGKELRSAYRKGVFIDTYTLSWLHPERVGILYPEGLPREYAESVERAMTALKRARELVHFEDPTQTN